MNTFKIHPISDLHLHSNKFYSFHNIIKPRKDTHLFVAGDIGNPYSKIYHDFIDFSSKNFASVVFIAGNHEFYKTNSRDETNDRDDINNTHEFIKKISKKYLNVFYLNNSYLDYLSRLNYSSCLNFMPRLNYSSRSKNNNLSIFGGTMWTNVNINNNRINYFLNKEYWEKRNKIHSHFLSEINKIKSHTQIVLTHHLPIDELLFSPLVTQNNKDKFSANLTNDFFNKCDIKLWICGHSHFYKNINKNGIQFVINPFQHNQYNPNLIIELN